jgi:hypothetical protein
MPPTFTYPGDDDDFAAALVSFTTCTDCPPSVKTAIPHHHHKHLAGAPATWEGHFCCHWAVDPDHPCYLCFESAKALDDHIKNDHAGKDGTFCCRWEGCCATGRKSGDLKGPNTFSNKPKLMRHVHSHTGHKPFPCSFPGCDRSFVTKEQLNNHLTTHTGSRQFKCSFCDKAFAVKSALTTHIGAVHKEAKPYKCDICGRGFADSSNLSKHKQTHRREKKQRRRTNSVALSTASTPSLSTPSIEPPTPDLRLGTGPGFNVLHQQHDPARIQPTSLFGTYPTLPPGTCCAVPLPTIAPCAAPAPTTFDPNCFCCDQDCPPPAGPATPCDSADDCGLDGFCDLPECLGDETCDGDCPDMSIICCDDEFCSRHLPLQWDDVLGQ